ncbi:hypothetical protein PF049_05505 [Erythrobacteraceae bacterium WH01K]|nr:hypothetical protein PF049_05505 [Erythrobacteraceae bacterium WH01K]
MRHLLMGVAAIAMAASATYANPGKGNDNGNGNGKGKPAAAANGNGGGNAARSNAGPSARGNASQGQAANHPARSDARPKTNRGNGNGNGNAANAAQRFLRANPGSINGNGNGNGDGNSNTIKRVVGGQGSGVLRTADRDVRRNGLSILGGTSSLLDGCPPGIAAKRNGCQPPGQAKQNSYSPLASLLGIGDRTNGRYYYDNGYLLRSGGSGVDAWLPLLGGALTIGSQWPGGYNSRRLPGYYETYYNLGGRDSYRYADNIVYRVDPETEAIRSVAALLTGDDFVVGQRIPSGYDVYNVPRSYRDQYYDRPDRLYRYSDGYVYQVDPETRMIAAAIELLV